MSAEQTLSLLDIPALSGLLDSLSGKGDEINADLVRRAIALKSESGGMIQTEELADCGRLYRYTVTDAETGRITHRYVGDIDAFLAPFRPEQAASGRVNDELFKGMNSPEGRAAAAADARVMEAGRAALKDGAMAHHLGHEMTHAQAKAQMSKNNPAETEARHR